MSYSHFTLDERECLLQLLEKKYSLRTIGSILGRSPSSISREISRNSIGGRYIPYKADKLAKERRGTLTPQNLKSRSGLIFLRQNIFYILRTIVLYGILLS